MSAPQSSRYNLLALVVALALTACIACADGSANTRTELRFSFWGAYHDMAMWKKIGAEFESIHSDVRVKMEYIPADYRSKVRLQMISGTAADVVNIDDETQAGFAVRGHLEPLDEYIRRDGESLDVEDFLPTSLESFQYAGVQHGLPWDGFSVMMFCNVDMFEQAGIPLPDTSWTWDDFRDIARKLTRDHDGDGRVDQFGTSLAFGILPLEPIFWAYGADVISQEAWRCGLFTPEGVAALQFVRDIVLVDNSSPRAGQMPGIQSEIAILTGRLGMVPGGAYLMQNLRATEGMRWDVLHMPKGPVRRATRVSWDGISIYSGSPHKDLAWRFVKHVLSRRSQGYIGRTGRAMPVRRQDVLDYFVDDETPEHEERFLESMEYGMVTPAATKWEAIDNTSARWLDRVRLGAMDTPAALDGLCREIDDLIEEERALRAATRRYGEPEKAQVR